MNKYYIIMCSFCLLIGMGLVSCRGSKVAVASYPEYTGEGNTGTKKVTKVKEEIDECEELSLNAPAKELRAYASSIDENRDYARHQATMFAKAQLVSDIESLVLNVMKGYRRKTKKDGVSSSSEDIKQDVGLMAENVVEQCTIVCSNRYALSDGTYECSVCISVTSPDVEKIAGAATLTEDEKLGVEFEAEKFRDSYKEELEKFRAQKLKK